MTPEREREIIERYLGLPFRHGARIHDRSGTIDCYGIVLAVYADHGIILEDYEYGDSREAHKSTIEDGSLGWEEVQIPRPGDVVVIMDDFAGVPNHVGVMLRDDRFIHCVHGAGTIVSMLHHWKNRIAGFYRHEKWF